MKQNNDAAAAQVCKLFYSSVSGHKRQHEVFFFIEQHPHHLLQQLVINAENPILSQWPRLAQHYVTAISEPQSMPTMMSSLTCFLRDNTHTANIWKSKQRHVGWKSPRCLRFAYSDILWNVQNTRECLLYFGAYVTMMNSCAHFGIFHSE